MYLFDQNYYHLSSRIVIVSNLVSDTMCHFRYNDPFLCLFIYFKFFEKINHYLL